MQKPSNLLLKLSRQLFTDTADQQSFIDALIQPKKFNPCILWTQEKPEILPFEIETAISWQPQFIDRLSPTEKPGKHPLHQQGYYYCLDFSSVFAASPLLTIKNSVNTIFDMCAAPGGKSIFAWKTLQPEILLCNEFISKRIAMLISNIKRCQIQPCGVFNRPPEFFESIISQKAEIVLVDAPCSGQSLIAKGDKAEGCFHPININKNANRQKRIIANSAEIVAPQGYLAYSTCTYSPEENEKICDWFLAKFPHFQPQTIPHLTSHQSHLTDLPCYRIWPQMGQGAGAFTVLFKNTNDGPVEQLSPNFWEQNSFRFVNKKPE
ncbi:MAG TPA: RsmB/NOP family class I SAM-dependent RNA methyltransferase [Halomicronema sp.]